ncbi:MAG: hypothetical protein FJX67_13745 [Alphaproteobacteria bacterium]|nr:hypothetical protein [Alphaproteobacteria bacterium]
MIRSLVLALVLVVAVPPAADAQTQRQSRAPAPLSPAAFHGTFQGSGVASNDDSLYFSASPSAIATW